MTTLNGHEFEPYHYAGMGNTERQCQRCGFRQDEQLEDSRVPPCAVPGEPTVLKRLFVPGEETRGEDDEGHPYLYRDDQTLLLMSDGSVRWEVPR